MLHNFATWAHCEHAFASFTIKKSSQHQNFGRRLSGSTVVDLPNWFCYMNSLLNAQTNKNVFTMCLCSNAIQHCPPATFHSCRRTDPLSAARQDGTYSGQVHRIDWSVRRSTLSCVVQFYCWHDLLVIDIVGPCGNDTIKWNKNTTPKKKINCFWWFRAHRETRCADVG